MDDDDEKGRGRVENRRGRIWVLRGRLSEGTAAAGIGLGEKREGLQPEGARAGESARGLQCLLC